MASLECSNSERQKRLREVNQESPAWNGIDYVEVENSQLIRVILFCDLAADFGENSPSDGDKEEVDIGEFVEIKGANSAAIETALYASAQRTITIRLKDSIAIGRYFLKVSAACPYFHLDPRFDGCDFEVFQSQQLEIDPRSIDACSNGTSEPEISYTARDYSSFYRLVSDRLALTMPQWRESHVPDIGVAITEIMAYVADHLAQFQDAVATEAYLSTARSRISARRHARLVDYNVDEGANSHTFLNFDVVSDVFVDPSNLFFITKPSDDPQFDETSLMMSSLNELPSDAYLPYELAYVSKTSSNQPFRAEDMVDPLRLVVQLTFLPSPKESPWFELLGHIRSSLKKFLDALVPRDSGILVAWRTLQSLGQLSAFQLQTLVDALNYLTRGNSLLRYVDRNDLSSWANQMLDACHGAKDRTKVCRIVLMELFPDCFDRTTIDSQLELLASHNEIEFYTWNQTNCCLTVGATHATLKDQWLDSQDANAADRYSVFESRKRRRALRLKQGDYLLIEEVLDPGTGLRLDADRSHRQVVKLTKVVRKVDPVNQIPLLEVWWDIADSLTFAVCISATLQTPPCTLLTKASVARGNVFPADHGLTIQDEPLSPVQSEECAARLQ